MRLPPLSGCSLPATMSNVTTTDRKFIIFTWGCQMNEDDSEQIASLLMRMGYCPTDCQEDADVAMLVTCSVRAKPEEKAKSKLGELRLIKQRKPDMIIGVCGCMAQKEGDKLRKHRPYLDLVVGTANIWRIPELIAEVERKRMFRSALGLPRSASDARIVPPRVSRCTRSIKSFVPVMYGCDNWCSYCVVPHVRGRERSRKMSDILHEIAELAERGTKEVTLLGQNVNSYRNPVGPAYDVGNQHSADFADLLAAVNEIEGIERIRFTTSHPKDLSDRLICAMRDLPKVCEHIHLAVQSGDDAVLARMNRKYTSAHIKERVAALRAAIPEIAITTDFLVGFPGETEEQFENTLRLAEEIRFDSAFMFAFNPIPGTAAAEMADGVASQVANARLRRLIQLQNSITCEINKAQVGRTYEVLVEGVSPKNPCRLVGLTRQNKTVNFAGSPDVIGKTVELRVTEGHLYGFVAEQPSPVCVGIKDGC